MKTKNEMVPWRMLRWVLSRVKLEVGVENLDEHKYCYRFHN